MIWGGFAIFWEVEVLTSGRSPILEAGGIPFAGGLYFTFGRFVYKRWRKRRTVYGVSTDRAFIAVSTSTLTDSPIKPIAATIRRSRDGRHASVTFASSAGWAQRIYANTGMDFLNRDSDVFAFYDVADADAVLAALKQARHA